MSLTLKSFNKKIETGNILGIEKFKEHAHHN